MSILATANVLCLLQNFLIQLVHVVVAANVLGAARLSPLLSDPTAKFIFFKNDPEYCSNSSLVRFGAAVGPVLL